MTIITPQTNEEYTFLDEVLYSRFVAGRAMGKGESGRIPTANNNVVAGDRLGDYRNDGTYEYKLLETSTGVLQWDRRTLDVGW